VSSGTVNDWHVISDGFVRAPQTALVSLSAISLAFRIYQSKQISSLGTTGAAVPASLFPVATLTQR